MKKVVLTFVVEDESIESIREAWESPHNTISMFVDSVLQEGFKECGMKIEE